MPSQKRHQRYDMWSTLRAPHMTSDGFMQFEAIATRAGVFPYRLKDGSIRLEYRPADELARADSLATLGKKPVTLMHPVNDDGEYIKVTPYNADKEVAGSTGDLVEVLERIKEHPDEAGPFVRITGQVFRGDAIASIQNSHTRAVSTGFSCDIEETPGRTEDGQPYDVIQRNIEYNHLALVPKGRAGKAAVLRADQADTAVLATDLMTPHLTKEDTMPKETFELLQGLAADMQALRADMDDMKPDGDGEKRMDADKRMDAMATKMDEMASKMDAYQSDAEERADMQQKMDAMRSDMQAMARIVKALMEAEGMEPDEDDGEREDGMHADAMDLDDVLARQHKARLRWHKERSATEEIAKALRMDGAGDMTDRDLRLAVARKVSKQEIKADASDDLLRGILMGVEIDDESEGYRRVGATIGTTRLQRADGADADNPRQAYITRLRNVRA